MNAPERFASVAELIAAAPPPVPLYCLRPRVLAARAAEFVARFPGRVLYAVKSNPLPEVLTGLWSAGVRDFDTASLAEIERVRTLLPGAGAYFMHPVKDRAAIAAAVREHGVTHLVVDDGGELEKVREVLGAADVVVVVRMATSGEGAFFHLSDKFGAAPGEAAALLRAVRASGYRAGLCFHVGSQCSEPRAFSAALEACAGVLSAAGVEIECLDVGGGFPIGYAGEPMPAPEPFIAAIEQGVAALDLPDGCELMAEPGRVLVAESISLLTRVQLRRGDALYLDDGVHGGLGAPRIGIDFPARAHRAGGALAAGRVAYTIYGPTCDGLDVLPRRLELPADLREGDWVEFERAGAYSASLRTAFNGFEASALVVVDDAPGEAAASDGRAGARRATGGA